MPVVNNQRPVGTPANNPRPNRPARPLQGTTGLPGGPVSAGGGLTGGGVTVSGNGPNYGVRPPMTGPVQNSLDPFDIIQFDTQRFNTNQSFAQQLTMLDQDEGIARLRRTRTLRDLTRQFREAQMAEGASTARRGLLNSGIRNQIVRQMAEGDQRARGEVEFNYGVQQGNFANQRALLERQLAEALGQINLNEAMLRTQLAGQVGIAA